jgi:bifunctional non-homologous end joining protein LigD
MAKKTATAPIAIEDAFRPGQIRKGDLQVKVDNQVLSLSHLDKVYWPKERYTKGDVLRYYYTMAKYVLPYLKNRPLILKRYPNGIAKPFFYQHDLKDAPEFVRTKLIHASEGDVHYALADDVASLLYLVNLGTIAQNPFHARVEDLHHPDYFIFDLDPEKGASFQIVCKVALLIKEVLGELGLTSYPKTSGSTGIHLYVPIKPEYTYKEIVPFAKEIARIAAGKMPTIATIERMTRNRRKTQVYIDYLQNIDGKTIASAYSVREKPCATVSAPLQWSELKKNIALSDFTMENMAARVKRKGDLFKNVLTKKQSLARAMKVLNAKANLSK